MRLAFAAALAMERNGKSVRLVANLLNQVQNGRVALQNNGFIFLAQNVKNLLFLRNAGNGLIDDLQRFERLRRGVKLPDSTVD